MIARAPRSLKTRTRIRVHLGTAELLATVVLLDRDEVLPGASAPVQLFLNQPAVAVWGQPFVVRSESPVTTLGGGVVLDPNAQKLRKPDAAERQLVEDLQSPEPAPRAAAALFFAGLRDWQPRDLARTAGIDRPDKAVAGLRDSGVLREIVLSPTRKIRVHRLVIQRLSERIEAALAKLHRQNPLRSTFDHHQLAATFQYLGDAALFDAILQHMQQTGRIRTTDRGIALAGEGPQLSQNERKLLAELIETYRQAGIQSPTVDECRQRAARNAQAVAQLIALAAADGDLVEIAAGYYLHADVDRQLKDALRQRMADGAGVTLSEIRELLSTTRKYAVPYCEYLDRIGFTRRQGDLRFLA
jgi:selenocysteine-specific elongation factor